MKKFKAYHMKNISVLFMLFFIGFATYAQTSPNNNRLPSKEDREKIIQMKISYVKENLGLTASEEKLFFPLYEENLKKEEALRRKQRTAMRGMKRNYTNMSEAEIEKALMDEMAAEQQILDLKKAQFEAYKKIIPLKKIVELKTVERSFNRMLLDKLRNKRPANPTNTDEN